MSKASLLSRRRFLKFASASSAVLALSGCRQIQDHPSPRDSWETPVGSFPVQTPPQPSPTFSSTAASVYYVDMTRGDDDNDGKSENSAWKTLERVGVAKLRPGDHLLFKRGERWTGRLDIWWSGHAGAPIVLGAYGEGPLPVIDGEDTSNCVVVESQSYIRLENLELARGSDACALFLTCSNIEIVDCDMHSAGNDCLNFFTGCTNCKVLGGRYHDAYARIAGPTVSGIEIADGGTDFEINGVEVYGNEHAGITLHNHQGTQVPNNVVIRNVHSHSNGEFGLLIFRQDISPQVAIKVLDSRFSSNTNDGVRIAKGKESPEYPQGAVFENCEFVDNGRYAAWVEGEDLSFHHCLFANGRMFLTKDSNRLNIYNGTFFLKEWGEFACFTVAQGSDNVDLKNCILATDDVEAGLITVESGSGENIHIDYIQYDHPATEPPGWHWKGRACTFLEWKAASLQDAHSPQPADPRFVDKQSGNFHLLPDSPCIDAGVDVGLAYMGNNPDLGCFEYSG